MRVVQVPQLEPPPEWREGLVLQDNVTITPELVEVLRAMIGRMNAAARGLPELQPLAT